jgi:hypothetical protein
MWPFAPSRYLPVAQRLKLCSFRKDCVHFLVMNLCVTLFLLCNATTVAVLNSHFCYLCTLSRQEEFIISYDHKHDLVLFTVYKMDM